MNRRLFISLSGLGITAIGVSFTGLLDFDLSRESFCAKPDFLSRLSNDEALRSVGKEFLKLYPAEGSSAGLMTELYGGPLKTDVLPRKDVRSIQKRLKNLIRNDFITGKTLILNGWVLSLTEARQCALFAILNS